MADGKANTKGKTKPRVVGELKDLLLLLRQNGVKSFDNGTFKVEFGERAHYAEPIFANEDSPEFDKKVKDLAEMSHEELLYFSSGDRG